MLLHRLILLVMLVVHSISEPTTNCDKMACFVPKQCTPSASGNREMMKLEVGLPVGEKCEIVAKIRSYSKKHILIVLESYDPKVTSVKFEQGPNTKFECSINDDKAEAKYKDVVIKTMINQSTSPLSCEFYVISGNDDVFDTTASGNVKFFTSNSDTVSFTFGRNLFNEYSITTCDPAKIKDGELGEVSGKLIKRVDSKFANLKCSKNYTLMFQENGKEYLKADTIICEKNVDNNDVYEYAITPSVSSAQPKIYSESFTAQCQSERTICTMCDQSMTLPPLEFVQGNCNTLKCRNGRIKFDNVDTKEEKAKCVLKGDNPVWKAGKIFLDANKKIECVEQISCDQKEAEQLCKKATIGEKCIVDTVEFLPKCLGNKQLKWGDNPVTVMCNKDKGWLEVNTTQGYKFKASENIFTCEDPPATTTSAPASAKTNDVIIGCAVGGIVLIGVIGGIIFLVLHCKKKKSRQPPAVADTTRVEMTTAREKEAPKSKESKSGNSSRKQIMQTESQKKEEELNKIANKWRDQWKVNTPEEDSRGREWRAVMNGDTTGEIHGATGRMDETIMPGELYIVKKHKKAEESVRRRDKKSKKNKKNEKDDSGPVDVEINDGESRKKGKNSEKKEKKKNSDRLEKAGDGQTTVIGGATTI